MRRPGKGSTPFIVGSGEVLPAKVPALPKAAKLPEPTDNDKSSHTKEPFKPNAPKE